MALPTKYDVILCEDVREEKGKKLTILGFFVGDDIIVPSDIPKEKINLKLTFLTRLKDGEGKWQAAWRILSPDGSILVPAEKLGEVEKFEGKHVLIAIQHLVHKVSEFGMHKFVLTLEDKDFEFEYEINSDAIEQ